MSLVQQKLLCHDTPQKSCQQIVSRIQTKWAYSTSEKSKSNLMHSNANKMRKLQETSFQHHWLVHFNPHTSASSAVVVYHSQKYQLILFPLTIKIKQATLFETRANPAKHKATASEAPSETKPVKSFCHRWLHELKQLEYDGENVLHYSQGAQEIKSDSNHRNN